MSWYSHKPIRVLENSIEKLLWDFGPVMESHHLSNHPDIMLFDYGNSAIHCFEVSCPADLNVITKETEKVFKYQPLMNDLRQLHPEMIHDALLYFCTAVHVSLTQ